MNVCLYENNKPITVVIISRLTNSHLPGGKKNLSRENLFTLSSGALNGNSTVNINTIAAKPTAPTIIKSKEKSINDMSTAVNVGPIDKAKRENHAAE